MRTFIGIDPGVHGAIAFYRPDMDPDLGVNLEIHDMPTLRVPLSRKKSKKQGRKKKDGSRGKVNDKTLYRHIIDLYALAALIKDRAPEVVLAAVEHPMSRPDDGAVGAHKFGFCCGAAQMAVAAYGVKMQLYPPATWHKIVNLRGGDGDHARRLATEHFSDAAVLFARKKDDGRADAALLAHLAYLACTGNDEPLI